VETRKVVKKGRRWAKEKSEGSAISSDPLARQEWATNRVKNEINGVL